MLDLVWNASRIEGMASRAVGARIDDGKLGGTNGWSGRRPEAVVVAAAAPSRAWRWGRDRTGRLQCSEVCLKPVEGDNARAPAKSPTEPPPPPPLGARGLSEEPRKRTRVSSTLRKPLTMTDLSTSDNESNVRVAYQGCRGAYSEMAALKAYPQCEAVPCEQFEVAFQAVELWLADKAVLPIENSVDGSIHRNYDLLLCHRLHIVGEVQLAVSHCLMALPGIQKEDLKRVLSHPQALGHCEMALSKLGVIRGNFDDTAGAAQFIASNGLRDTGAIASSHAAEIYGLNILEHGIQDAPDNITRFLILAREPIMPRTDKPFRTSIVFTLVEGPGVLYRALGVFALRKISLTKIESRPQRQRPVRVVDDLNYGTAKHFDYLFYIDFEASMAEPRAQNALSNLQEFATFLRVLGSYPMDTTF